MRQLLAAIVLLGLTGLNPQPRAILVGGQLKGGSIGVGTSVPGVACLVNSSAVSYCASSTGCAAGGQVVSVSTLSTVINGASQGNVVCLQRGQTWSATAGLSLTTSFPGSNRVTICASTGSSCSDSGAANPLLHITGVTENERGIKFSGGAGGYEVRNIDLTGTDYTDNGTSVGLEQTTAYEVQKGSHDIRFVGGTVQTFFNVDWSDVGSGANAAGIEFGTCAAPLTISGLPANQAETAVDHHAFLGSFDSTAFRLNVSGWAVPTHGSRSHFIDLTSNGTHFGTANSSHTITVECSKIATNLGSGVWLKAASGQDLTVQDNTVTDCQQYFIGFDSHGPDGCCSWGWTGADVRRNKIDYSSCSTGGFVEEMLGKNIRIYNNVARMKTGTSSGGFVQLACNAGYQAADQAGQTVQVYHNTIFRTGNENSGVNLTGSIQHNNPGCNAGTNSPTDVSVVNNLNLEDSTTAAPAFMAKGSSSCSDWGTNGAQVHDNFEYATSATPDFSFQTTCTGTDNLVKGGPTSGDDGAAGGAGDVATAPTLTGDGGAWAGTLPGDFTPTSNASKVCGRGDSTYCTLAGTDYNGATRTTCDIGAIACPP